MIVVPQIIRSRQHRNERKKRSLSRRLSQFALGFGIVVSLLISFLIIATTVLFSSLTQNLPSPEYLPLLFNPPQGKLLQPTRLFDRSGEEIIAVLQYPSSSRKQYLSMNQDNLYHVPTIIRDTTIAAADPDFWTHQGFSWDGVREGTHPTLAQKLVADSLLWAEPPSIERALKERLLAAQITSLYGREKIIEWYLNSTDYGRLAYGVDAAARAYFGKSATELSLAEAAVLAATAKSPQLNPIDAPLAVLETRDEILQEMFNQDLISSTQLRQALKEGHTFQPPQDFSLDIAPEFTRLVLEQTSEYFPLDRVSRGGLNIVTTLDYNLQLQAECTASTQIARVTDSAEKDLPEQVLETCEMARLLPSIQQDSSLIDSSLASNVVVLDPHTGQILALVGGGESGIDPTRLPGRQPGSILTPFIYLTSFTRGMSPSTLLWDIPANLVEGVNENQNQNSLFHGPVSVRTALVNDYLSPAVQILTQMDPDQVWHTAQQLGLRNLQVPPEEGAYRLPFSGGEATLLEISQAYGVLSSQGILAGSTGNSASPDNGNTPINPQVISKVIETSGEEWLNCAGQITECRTIKRPVTSPQLAYLITNILSDETARWPSLGHPNPLEIGRPVAGKIGSTITGEDTWTIGYTPDLVTAVWIGTEDPNQDGSIPPTWSAGLWHAIIQYATRDQPTVEFSPPPGITELQVCDPSGMLPTEECPNLIDEVFIIGNEPTQTDHLFQTFLINMETGRLATIFTSPALIDEEVFMVVPPEAEEWARDANIAAIPEAYDVLDVPPSQPGNARITSPSMFSNIKGSVPIMGRAAGEDFSFYRLQIGAGLNPLTWLQIGDDVHKPVQNGQLGIWDTTDLNGLHALQLIVAYDDDRVESTTIQVTIDNQAPKVVIRYPDDGQEFSISDNREITIQTEISDDLDLAEVEFFIDGELVSTLISPPYAIPWRLKIGDHILRVRASDRAGNISEAKSKIIVER
jgi:membrane carboxypeptidase/penicillin-binding protein